MYVYIYIYILIGQSCVCIYIYKPVPQLRTTVDGALGRLLQRLERLYRCCALRCRGLEGGLDVDVGGRGPLQRCHGAGVGLPGPGGAMGGSRARLLKPWGTAWIQGLYGCLWWMLERNSQSDNFQRVTTIYF